MAQPQSKRTYKGIDREGDKYVLLHCKDCDDWLGPVLFTRKAKGKNSICKFCSRKKSRKWGKENAEHAKATKRRRHKEIRLELIGLLGGKCALCPESDTNTFEFDHIEGDGWLDRKGPPRSSLGTLRRMKKELWRYRILCGSCHVRKSRLEEEYGGIKAKRQRVLHPERFAIAVNKTT